MEHPNSSDVWIKNKKMNYPVPLLPQWVGLIKQGLKIVPKG